MSNFVVRNSILHMRMRAPHPQVMDNFPQYALQSATPQTIVDYSNPGNVTGHQQRAWLVDWCIRAFLETGTIGVDLGSAGVNMPFCLSTDAIGNGEQPVYGGEMQGVQLVVDANDLSVFGSNSFGFVIGNHVLEHMACNQLSGHETQAEKFAIDCKGEELADLIDNHWLRIIVPGGYLCHIFPDENPCRRGNSSSLLHDPTHNHMLSPGRFQRSVLDRLKTPVDVVEFDTLKNNFSINIALRKK